MAQFQLTEKEKIMLWLMLSAGAQLKEMTRLGRVFLNQKTQLHSSNPGGSVRIGQHRKDTNIKPHPLSKLVTLLIHSFSVEECSAVGINSLPERVSSAT